MARKRKGRDISGWLIVDKPAGITSTSVVNKVRWALDAKKAGHAGTLDPEATGVLAVALGEATKTVPYITDALKAYVFTIRFGAATNTDDAEGQVIASSDARPDDAEITAALPAFVGDIEQVPPKFSAVKIDGERAYKLARDGEDVTLAARPLFVDSLTMLERADADHVTLELGEMLGCFGHVQSLRRIWSGPFDVEDAVSFATVEDLAKDPALDAHLMPVAVGLADLTELRATDIGAARLKNGNPGQVLGTAEYGEEVWVSYSGQPLAVGIYRGGEVHPARVFNL